jgi:hypothetical protein
MPSRRVYKHPSPLWGKKRRHAPMLSITRRRPGLYEIYHEQLKGRPYAVRFEVCDHFYHPPIFDYISG